MLVANEGIEVMHSRIDEGPPYGLDLQLQYKGPKLA